MKRYKSIIESLQFKAPHELGFPDDPEILKNELCVIKNKGYTFDSDGNSFFQFEIHSLERIGNFMILNFNDEEEARNEEYPV